MKIRLSHIINSWVSNPKRLFLLDSSGAFLTAFFLVAILSIFEEYFGMPRQILTFLSIIALIYAIYSIYCYYFVGDKWRLFLKIICIANGLYCCLTIGLVFYFYPRLTILGITYFLLEIILICGLVIIERKALAL